MQIHNGFARPLRAGFLNGTLGVVSLLALSLAMASAKHTQLEAVVKGNTGFTSKLYQALAQKEGNVFFSPISVHAVLSMLQQGAKGKTQEVLGEVLGVPLLTESAEGYQHLMKSLIAINGHVELNLANKIYIQEKYGFQDNFALTMSQNFLSDVQALDFAKGEDARQTINSWVEEKTKNKIKDLIPENSLGSDTRLVLVNAIYFKGKWKYTFNASDTKTEKFYLDDDENSVDVQMMHLKQRLFYKEDENLDAKVLELPYDSNIEDLSLVIILPNKRDGIAELEDKLATVDLSTITDNMQKPEVFVSLPKFKIESSMDLKDPLKEIGLGDLFTESAGPLWDHKVWRRPQSFQSYPKGIHLKSMRKAQKLQQPQKPKNLSFVGVHIKMRTARIRPPTGFLADHPFLAMVGVMISARCMPPPPEDFIADHPFIAVLQMKQNERGIILFYGKITHPK
nr:unnamed protein product [Callosobruchus analis]